MNIPAQKIDEVKERASLAAVISEYVQLKPAGRSLLGLCPFHQEKTPSFHVHDEDGYFNCFGCGKKGDVFAFVMEKRGLTFPEAIRFLAQRFGVNLPEERTGDREDQREHASERKALRQILLQAEQIYRSVLQHEKEGEAGREYLQLRGITEETAEIFRLGYAPDSWDFILGRLAKLSPELVESSRLEALALGLGLIKKRAADSARGEGCFDTFRKRLIFPISRSDGQPLAFGARVIVSQTDQPKYLNSPESSLYQKRKTLFGIQQAFEACRKSRHAFLVEGYTDVLSLSQQGIRDVVATCGTAITPEHASILRRFVSRVTLLFDGDAAGRKAAARSFDAFLNSGIEVRPVFLPDGEDPDSLARRLDAKSLQALFVASAVPMVEVYLSYLLQEIRAASLFDAPPSSDSSKQVDKATEAPSAAERGRVAERFATLAIQIKNSVEREVRLQEAADWLGVSLDSLEILVKEKSGEVAPRKALPLEKAPTAISRDSFSVAREFAARRPIAPASTSDEPAAQKKRSSEQRSGRALRKLEAFQRQFVIALLCNPKLSQVVRLSETNAQSIHSETAMSGGLVEELREFLKLLEAHTPRGLFEILAADSEQEEGVLKLKEILVAAGLDDLDLLEEAFRQIEVGGNRPDHVIRDSGGVFERSSMQFEIERIRKEEAEVSDEERRQSLVMEKIKRKRALQELESKKT